MYSVRTVRTPTQCCIFIALLLFPYAASTIQFTPPYQGQTIRGTVGYSVNFTWKFTGDVGAIEWGLRKAGSLNTFETKLLSLDQSGNPTFTHQGYHGRVIGSRAGDSSSGLVIITLSAITVNDAKSYLCVLKANNFQDSDQFDYINLVVEDPPIITQPISANASYNEGSPVTITCTATGTPDPDVRWIRNTQVKRSGVKKADLTLTSISKADTGIYTCRANNSVGRDDKQLDITVKYPPIITQPISGNASYNEGSPVTITCTATGTPDPDVRWIRNTQVKSSGVKKARLTLNSISKADAGIYTCRANNSVGSDEKQLEITVKYPATIESATSSVSKSWIGQTVTLTCKSDGVPTPTLSWYKPDGNKFNLVKAKENTAVVPLNSDGDFGLYNCTADNGFLPASKTVLVRQIKAPGYPIITSKDEDIQATFMKVKWDPPADNGGSPITAYRVVILQSDVEIRNKNVTKPATKSLLIKNLNKSTNYTVKVFARNYVFEGNAIKKTFQTRFKGIPAAVDIIDLPPDAKEGDVTIKWNTPKDNGEPITQYTVYQRTVNDDGTTQPWIKRKEIKDLSNRVVVVTLKKGKKYEFVVTATNSEGESLKEKDKIKTIAVGDIPEAVVIKEEVKGGDIILKWEEPDNNGAAITQYDIYQRIANEKTWTNIGTIKDTSKREFVFEGEKGKEYEFAVTATNKHGESSKDDSIKRVNVAAVTTTPTENRTGSSCDDEKKTLHAVYMTVTLLLLISNLVLIYLLWRMRSRSGEVLLTKLSTEPFFD